MITIQNEFLKIGINKKGAELSSIMSQISHQEYMWEGNPEYWNRHSCILFPVIGVARNDEIIIGENHYPMTKHGFLRDADFELTSFTKESVSLIFKSNSETTQMYPFKFDFQVDYSVVAKTCAITYTVINKDSIRMPFNIGGHPAFKCPLVPGEFRKDYKLCFSDKESQDSPIIGTNGLITSTTQVVLNDTDTLLLKDDLFDRDALILSNLNSDKISLINGSGKKIWTVRFPGFTHLGIWSKNRNSPFVCIEPWYGIADEEDGALEFEMKKSIQWVHPNANWSCIHYFDLEE